MTEIPEHLLARSRERRSALGLGGDDGGASEAGAAPASPPATAASAAPAPAAPAAPVVVEEKPPPPDPPYVAAAKTRKKVPFWVVPILLALPIWGFMYVGTLEPPPAETLLSLGETEYATCASCHGASGGGGSGRPLSGGEVTRTFPQLEEHVWWVVNGSPASGTPFGDPDREGGQRAAYGYNGVAMAGFGDTLSAEEVLAVVAHERVAFGEDVEGSVDLAHDLEILELWAESAELPEHFEGDEASLEALIEAASEFRSEVEG